MEHLHLTAEFPISIDMTSHKYDINAPFFMPILQNIHCPIMHHSILTSLVKVQGKPELEPTKLYQRGKP